MDIKPVYPPAPLVPPRKIDRQEGRREREPRRDERRKPASPDGDEPAVDTYA